MRAAFSMIAVLAATLALSATVAVADPAKPWQIDDVANAPWQATFVDSFYDCDANETVFTYSVAANAEADLGHWIVAAPDCSGADLVNDQEWEYATDPVTGLTGFLWSWGQELSTERMYRVRLTGKVGVDAAASYGVSGGSRYAIGTVLGPVCGGDESYPETEKADEVTPDCTESIPTAFPEGCTDPDCYELVDSDTTHPLCQSEPVIVQTFRKEIEADGLTWATQVKRTVKFDDSEAPTWDEAVPADRTYECDLADSIPDAAALSVVDNCGFDDGETVSSIEACEKVTNTSCPQHYYIVRSWTAVDECGNERCATQTITVTDTNPPTFDGVEEDKHLACADVSADPSLLDDPVVTASDSCSDDVLFEEHKTRIADECTNTFLIRRTYKATDECGNTDHASQLVTVFDDVPPVLTYNTSVEDTRTVECREIPEPMEVTAFDECADASVEVNYTQTPENPDALPCPDRCRVHVERKWTACDDCGNTVELKRDIIVLDRTAPTFTLAAEADVTVQCDAVPDQRDEPVDDACDDSITMAECTETRTNTSCENEYVLNRTCTATDCCGNSVSRTRIITVVDEQITCPAAPGDLNVKCTDIPDHTELAMPEQACSADATQTLREDAYEESCSYDIVRHWDFKDCAGNECSVSQTISVVDDIKPVFDECPTDKSVFCTLPEAETLTGTDNCNDTVTVTSNDENDVECPGRQTTVRTWTADDGCGNTETCVQTINVYDNEAPEWTSFPDDLELNCQDDVPVVAPTASDACSAVTVVQVADETTENGCKNNYTRVISWTATDECGNVLGPRNQTIVVRDNESPVLDNKPADQTDECSEISCPEDVGANDNCEGLDLDYSEARVDLAGATCDGIYELHRTWTATDDCGHVDTHTQVITVQDSNPPVYNGPELTDMYVPCDQDIVLPTEPKFEWTDLCSEVEEVFPTNTTRQTPMQCANNLTTVVTWTASDECGNTASVSKTYFIFDKIDPVVEQLDDQTIECDVDFTPTTPEYSDSCGNVDLDTTEETEDLDCVDTGYLSKTVYTHTATDACGNTATTQNTVSVTDSDAPVMVCPEAEISATCCDVPDPAVLTATDNCAATQDIEAVTTRQDGPCVNTYNLTHVWTATDACGNTATCTQVVVIKDEEAPQLEGVPTADATASCEDVPKPEKVCASDNCVGVDLNFTEERHTETCDGGNYTLTRTWTATDACGHVTTQGYDLVVTDEVDPTWNTDLPESSSVECDKGARDPSTPPTVTQPGCEDTCASVTVTPDHSQDEQGCPQDINFNYEWTCEDACGNSIEHSITIEQRDTTKPTFGWSGAAPVDASYKCELPEAETPSGHDSCSTGTVSYEATPTVNTSCPIQVTEVREWTVTDECGNADTHTVTVTVDAPAAPTWDFAPADSTIGCKDDAPIAPALTATDDCGNNVTDIVFEEKQENHGCTELIATPTEYDIVRTWTATDQCGQVIVYTQTIFVRDQAPPTITPPAPRVQKDKCAMDTTLTGAIGSDDCYFEVTTTEQDINTPRACPYEWHMEYTFTATDNCGKSASAVVVEEYEYTLLPTVVDEDSITTLRKANCHNVSLTPDVIEWQDGCNNALGQGTVETTTEPGSCPNDYVLVWTYSITDSCGLSNTFVIRTHVFDKTPPVLHFEWPVEDQTVECPFVPPAPEATATDTCGGDVTIEFVEFKVGFDDTDVDADCCNYDLYRVWRATDACNNTATMTQKVTVQDTIPPRWNGSSIEDVIVECPEDVERPNITWFEAPFASGYCPASADSTACTADDTASFEFVLNGVEYSLSSARFIKWVNGFAFLTGTASSAGPEADLEVNFQFNLGSVSSSDGLAQAINADTLEDSCYGPDGVVLAQWVFFEELQGNLTNVDTTDVYEVSGTKYLQLGLGATGRNELYGLRTTFAANIGGVETAGEIALQLDTCDTSDWGFPELECGPEITATEDTIFVEGSCPGEWVRTYIWNATDSAGNKNSTTMKVTSHDNTDPVWTVTPPSTASGVCADPAVPNAEAEDTCSDVEVSMVSSPREPGSRKCDFHYSFVRTWTAVDECGNDIETEQHVSVEDNVDPELTITGEPDEKEYECVGDLPAAATFSCSDNCDSTSASNVVTCQGPDVVPTDSNCSQIVTYNYLAVDACGNQDSHTYSVLVNDAKAPQCTENCAAETTEIDCSVVPEEQTVTFVDNCEGETVVSPVRTVSDGDFCPKTYTDTYNLVDNCGNHAAEIVKVYLAYDKTAPTITVPANRTVTNCADAFTPTGEEEIASGAASASDDCAVAGVTVTFVRDEEVYEGDCLVLVIRHWESVDDCGNKRTAKSYIIVDDQSAPTFEPASIDSQILECDETIPCPETVSISDNCDGVHLSFSETEEAGACPQERVITRTWTGLDACGNTDQLSYTITVQDTTKPEFVGDLPTGGTYECSAPDNSAADVTVTDNCDGAPTVVYTVDTTPGSCAYDFVELRKWNVTDACGNWRVHEITVTVQDTQDPFAADLDDIVHECDSKVDPLPLFGVPVFSDNCGDVTVTNSTATVDGDCDGNYTVTRTWVGTDECGNDYTVDQKLTVQDTTAPTLEQPEAELSAECQEEPASSLAYSDNCGIAGPLDFVETSVPDSASCSHPYTVSRTWTATDDCGHVTTAAQEVRVTDTLAPEFVWAAGFAPEDFTTQCTSDEAVPVVFAFDECKGNLTDDISYVSTTDGDACRSTETRKWTVCDCSENCISFNYTITYIDDIKPVFDAVPEAGPFECGDDVVSLIPDATASDPDCTGKTFTVSPSLSFVDGGCDHNYTIVADYSVTDDCGNTETTQASFEHHDITAPEITGDFSNVTVECGEQVDDVLFECSDNCDDGDSGITSDVIDEELDDGDDCENTKLFKQTYFCQDSCGHRTEATRFVIVVDTTAPTIDEGSLPPNSVTECGSPPEGDLPTPSPDIPYTQIGNIRDAMTGEAPCAASGGFGVSTSNWLNFHIDETQEATWKLFNEGAGIDQYLKYNAELFADGDDTITFTLNSKVQRYSAPGEDPCSEDRTEFKPPNGWCPPHLEFPYTPDTYATCYGPGAPADPAAWEFYSAIEYAFLTGSGKCAGAEIKLTARGPPTQIGIGANSKNLNFGGSFWFEWRMTSPAMDPVACPIPEGVHDGDVNVDMDPWDGAIIPNDCPDNSTLTSETVTEEGGCPANYTEITTWTISDCVGNSNNATRYAVFQDSVAPVISNLDIPTKYECGDVVPPPASPTAEDACDGAVAVSGPFLVSETGDSCETTYTYMWNATDECGHVTTEERTVSYCDTTNPTFAEGDDVVVKEFACNADRDAPVLEDRTPEDSCSSVTAVLTEASENNGCTYNYTVTYTWTATDACGNEHSVEEKHVVTDEEPPTITSGAPECIADSTDSLFVRIEDVTQSGIFFTAEDTCGTPTISIDSCSSDQDTELGAAPGAPGFTDHCFYVAEEDALYLRRSIVTDILEGRLYTITGTATDACGHKATTTRDYLIANNLALYIDGELSSWERRNISGSQPESCVGRELCVHMCPPCIYDVDFCPESDNTDNSLTFSQATYDDVNDQTEFIYAVSMSATRVTLGLNLAEAELLSISGDSADGQRFGFQRDSYFSGITWHGEDLESGIVSFILRGDWTSEEDNTAYEIKWVEADEEVTRLDNVKGPCKRAEAGEASIAGTVGVSGTVYDPEERSDSPQLPVGGIVVQLLTKEAKPSITPTVLAYTATKADGSYKFTDLEAGQYQVVIDEEGFLEGSLQGAHRYLTTDTNALVYKYGEPRCVPTVPDLTADLGILIDERKWDTLADRARYLESTSIPEEEVRGRADTTDTNFNGNAKSIGYWQEQLRAATSVDADRLAIYVDIANAHLAGFGASCSVATVEEILNSGNAYQQRVAALALNHAAGFGVFRPFRELQALVLDYAIAVGCAPSNEDVVSAMVLKMLSAN